MVPRFGLQKDRKHVGQLRRSQTITTFGCGALVDFPRLSGIMAGLDSWNIGLLPQELKISERNLEEFLGKEFFVQVSSPESDDNGETTFGLPVFRFPNYYYCPDCHMLDYYWKISKVKRNSNKTNSPLTCNNCGEKVRLIPSRFVVACINGHIDDFPYDWWVHRKKGICDNSRLQLKYKGATGGLDSIHVYCETCGAHATMEGCMGKEALKGLKCKGKMAWLGKGYTEPEECSALLRTMQRGANNVYYSVNKSALTIPPWSNIAQKAINQNRETLEDIFDEDEKDIKIIRLKKLYSRKDIENEYGISEEIFVKEAFKRFDGQKEEINEKSLLINEYKAFCQPDVDDPYFKTTSESVPNVFNHLIEKIKLVKRLREVQVLLGFRRILPEYEKETEGLYEREFTPISKQPLKWLPAVELFGEGIFIKFNENALKKWESKNTHRYIEMEHRLGDLNINKEMFSPRYVLLHTFSHLLIRQLSFQCGYASASLKEKIYSTYPGSEEAMSGILIYTATSDSDGSLGGLVREGTCLRMENTIKAALQTSSWCSNDPICIEAKSQGFNSLNYASCHACTLLPETSCEARNCLLDRASITGTPDNKEIGLFKQFI